MNSAKKKEKKDEFQLPRYLMLDKGSMWFDIEGEQSSGVRLFAFNKVLVGRETQMTEITLSTGERKKVPVNTPIEKDEHGNKNLMDFGKKPADLPWYVDVQTIPNEKLSRILLAYKSGILVEADPKNPPKPIEQKVEPEFSFKDNGDRIFTGKNKEMYTKLQNYPFAELRKFIKDAPLTISAKRNIIDLYDYEIKGYNPLNRPRQEVLEVLKEKLREYGPGISVIRINEE